MKFSGSITALIATLMAGSALAAPSPYSGTASTDGKNTQMGQKLKEMTMSAASGRGSSLQDTATNFAGSKLEQYFRDEFLSDLERTEFSLHLGEGKPVIDALTVQPLYESEDLNHTFFYQGSVFTYDSKTTINNGLGYRRMLMDDKLLLGTNGFFDYEFPHHHQRASIGAEIRSSVAELNANKYYSLSGWHTDEGGVQARALPGQDLELGIAMPYLPYVKAYGKVFKWDAYEGAKDLKGRTLSLAGSIVPGLEIEAGRVHYSTVGKDDENFVRLTYTIYTQKTKDDRSTQPFILDVPYEFASMESHRLDKVRRENRIVKQKRFSVTAAGF